MSKGLYVCVRCHVSREFGRWKVNSLALEKGVGVGGSRGLSLPLDPEFQHAIRQLGRRPTLHTITESLIKKYGTHLLLSATLGGIVEYTELHNKYDSHSLMCFFLLKERQFSRLCLPKQQRIKQFSGSLFFLAYNAKSLCFSVLNNLAYKISRFPITSCIIGIFCIS